MVENRLHGKRIGDERDDFHLSSTKGANPGEDLVGTRQQIGPERRRKE
jgi:hypothetical protein